MSSRPNILLICSDQHTPGVTGCYGNSIIRTPNLDRLADEGLLFSNAYCNLPLCVPSRMSFMTGKLPSRIGVFGNSDVLDSRIPTYAHMLTGTGYRTVLAGRMHFVGPDQYHGFQERIGSDFTAYAFHCSKINRFHPLKGRLGNCMYPDPLLEVGSGVTCTHQMDSDTTAAASRWLSKYAASGSDDPFMMTVGYFAPHCPYIAENKYYKMYRGSVAPHQTGREEIGSQHPFHQRHRQDIQLDTIPAENITKATTAYYGLVSFIDDQIGSLIDTLRSSGVLENTIIIYFSDHGEMLSEHGRWHKSSFYEASSGVPLIIRFPSTYADQQGKSGSCVDTPVSLVDLFPTLCEIAGKEISFEIDGDSLLRPLDPERPVFCEYYDHSGSCRMIRRGRYKLNYYEGYEACELFDLHEDPGEKRNLAGDAEFREIEESLKRELFRDGWSDKTKIEHDRYCRSIGFHEIGRGMKRTEHLIEEGTITEIPGYEAKVSWYESRLDCEESYSSP